MSWNDLCINHQDLFLGLNSDTCFLPHLVTIETVSCTRRNVWPCQVITHRGQLSFYARVTAALKPVAGEKELNSNGCIPLEEKQTSDQVRSDSMSGNLLSFTA